MAPTDPMFITYEANNTILASRLTAIYKIPDELLDGIFAYLVPLAGSEFHGTLIEKERTNGFSALKCLSQVSRRFHRLAEPHFYRNCSCFRGQDGLRKLLRTLVRRPDLAATVRQLDIQDIKWQQQASSTDVVSIPVSVSRADELLAAAQPLCFNENGRFSHDLANGQQDAEIILLLLLSIYSLLISATSHQPGASATTSKSLAALIHLQISHAISEADGLGFLRHIFLLPSIRHFTAHNVGHPANSPTWPPNISHITHLSLLDTDVWSTDVLDLCRACTATTSLTLRWGRGDADLPLDSLCAALRLHGDTLKHLVLDIRQTDMANQSGMSEPGDLVRPLLFGRAGLVRLRTLEISGILLAGEKSAFWPAGQVSPWTEEAVRELPGSLEVVRVNHSSWAPRWFGSWLWALAESYGKGKRVTLRRVDMYPRTWGLNEVGEQVMEELRPVFGRAGVELVRPEADYLEPLGSGREDWDEDVQLD